MTNKKDTWKKWNIYTSLHLFEYCVYKKGEIWTEWKTAEWIKAEDVYK